MAQRAEPLPLKQLQQFAKVFSAIKNSYVEPMTDAQLIDAAIKGMFSDLDPHSAYLDPEAFKEMEALTQGGFGGLGIEIGVEDSMPKVISPIEDTPAERAGVLAGDVITHIDGKASKGLPLNEAVKLMRGKPGTPVTLTIRRDGQAKPLLIKIVRDLIKVRSVRGERLEGDIGYVRITQFQERTVADLVKRLQELGKGQPLKGLVLDLRNDPGGLLDGAIGVSSAFLPSDALVVSTKGRIASANREYFSRALNGDGNALPAWTRSVPMVVLVNVGSASASEIVAGALQDHKRAVILGNRTFGKGSVQSVLPLSEDSGVKLTTARYYTPSGRSIQVTGVAPDVIVDDTPHGNLFRLPREGELEHHLEGVDEAAGKTEAPAAPQASEEKDKNKPEPRMFQFGSKDDFQLQQAINHLLGRPVLRNDPSAPVKPEPAKSASAKPAARGADAASGKAGQGEAKPAETQPGEVERYRLTPEGVVPAQP
jgi:carboxyl-terminal processing protease